jgi:hypothetical protein
LIGFFLAWNFYSNTEKGIARQSIVMPHFEISSPDNFESVFVHQNDSIYRRIWSEAFENHPETAFLISCSYYLVTKDSSILNDVEISESQLETMYNKHIISFPANRDGVSGNKIAR